MWTKERDLSVGKLSASHADDLGSNLGGCLTWLTSMLESKITRCKCHIAPVRLNDWCIINKRKCGDICYMENTVRWRSLLRGEQ